MTAVLDIVRDARARQLVLRPRGYDDRLRYAVHTDLPGVAWDGANRCWRLPDTAGSRARLGAALPRLQNIVAVIARDPLPIPPVRPQHEATPLAWTPDVRAWDHQLRAHAHLRWAREHLGAALLDCGLGTGKTRMSLDHLRSLDERERRALVIAPKSVLPVWSEQAALHGGPALRVVVLDGDSVRTRVAETVGLLTSGSPAVVVLGWAVLQRLDSQQKQKLRAALEGATVIADECHRAGAPGSAQSQSLAFVAQRAAMRIGGSGTPLSHSPLNAYAIFRYLDAGVFGTSYSRFADRYAMFGGYQNHTVVSYKNLDELAALMAPYTFTAGRELLDLPEAQHVEIKVDLPPDAQRIYRQLRDEAVADLRSGTLVAASALTRLLRLAQVTSGSLPAQDGSERHEVIHHAKAEALADLLGDSDSAEPWVVFGRFTHDLDVAAHAAKSAGRRCMKLDGRHDERAAWHFSIESGEGPVLAVQIAAGSEGVNDLVDARYCAYLSVGYSLSTYEQSLGRVHRPGQARPVTYYHIIARGTVDLDIRRALAKRADVLRFVSDALIAANEAAA